MQKKIFDYFSGAYCINLVTRPDRRKSAQELFDKLDIPVEFYTAIKNKDPVKGCFESHINVAKQAYEAGLDTVIIFEDDIAISESPTTLKKRINSVISFLKHQKDWDIFYLGAVPIGTHVSP